MTGAGALTFGPAAEALFRLGGPTAVSAGAGSGKTTALVELAVRLLSGAATGTPLAPSEVVAITFTDRAGEELAERLRGAAEERARQGDDGWAERLRGLDAMAVGTIHGFAARLLREHPLEAGIDPEVVVLDEEEAAALRLEAARAEVVAAVDAGRPGARQLAAGLGLRGLAEVVDGLVRERATLGLGEPPRPAPGRPGEGEVARRSILEAAGTLAAGAGRAATAAGRRTLGELAEALARLPAADRDGPLELAAARRLAELAGPAGRWRRSGGDPAALWVAREALVEAARAILPLAAEVQAAPQVEEICALLAGAEVRYAGSKAARRALDFDDLLVRTRDLLQRDRQVRWGLRSRIRALLVDEYQDVNGVQQAIFDLVGGADPGGAEAPPPAVLVAVGDLKQSIYRFRGADVTVLAGLAERFRRGDGRVLHLSENHRSAPAVLDLVNAVFESCMRPGPGARPYQVSFGEADRLVPRRQGGASPACEIMVDAEEGNAAERRAREARAIAGRIGALVSGRAGVAVRERGPDGVERPRVPRHGDVAILFRRLTQIGEYERTLRQAGIPYRMARGGGFYQASEVRDLGELLSSLGEPGDALAWAALLRSPFCGISDGVLLLASRMGLGTLWRREPGEVVEAVRRAWNEAAGVSSAPRPDPLPAMRGEGAPPSPQTESGIAPPPGVIAELERLRRFLVEWRALRALRGRLGPHEILERAAERLDLEAALLAGPEGERRAFNVRKAVVMARRFAEAGGTAAGFATRLRDMAARPPREPEADLPAEDAVAVLSVHQAKGLEWPVVFVADMAARPRGDARRAFLDDRGRVCAACFDLATEEFVATGSVEAAREEASRAEAAESRRLLYVALTRARDYLVLSGGAEKDGAETWSGLVATAATGRLATCLPLAEAGSRAVGPALEPGRSASSPPGPTPAVPRLASPAAPPAVRLAVTDLAEYARCPRRHWLARRVGLPERGPSASSPQDDPARATARGTLAHAMLSEVDLAAPPLERQAQLQASAARRGLDPGGPAVRRILRDVRRFLDSPPGRRLASLAGAGGLDREVPFLLRVGERPACYLTGAIDALGRDRSGITVVDFKYAVHRPGAAERYRFQLLAYALAASRAHPGRKVRAVLQYLRAGGAEIDLTPSAKDLGRFAAEASGLALAAWRGEGERLEPADLGRTQERCRAEGCGYVFRCYRSPRL